MKITHTAIDHPRATLVITMLVVIMAVIAAWEIPVQRTPAITKAVILVAVPYPGAEPSEVEEQITRKIEDSLQRLNKVDFIASTSLRGSSVTQIIFLDGVAPKQARADVEHYVNEIRRELPLGRDVQPIITDIDFESMPLMLVNLSGPPAFDEGMLKQIAEDVQEELEVISGVANTQLFGGREREIHVNVNPDRLSPYGLSLNGVRNAIVAAHSEMPGGPLDSGEFNYQIRNEAKFRGVDDIRNVVLAQQEGRLIRVGDVAEVQDTFRRMMNIGQLDGRNSATIIVNKEPNINTLGAARAIKQRVGELRGEYPHLVFSTSRDISEEISLMFWVLGSSAVFGALLVLLILAWTMSIRASILVLLAVPMSTAVGVIFLLAFGIPVSNMVIFSFILVLGMVVDGAIIVCENIYRHLERGESPITAAKIGIEEVAYPVIAADLTTVAAFLPMILVPGIMGDFMGVMPKVVSVSLLGSVLVDHFLLPVLAAYWHKRKHLAPGDEAAAERPAVLHESMDAAASRMRPNLGFFTRGYAGLLRHALGNRWVVVGCCVLGFVWARAMMDRVGFEFFPSSDRGQFEINFELPLGYSIEQTLAASRVVTDPLLEMQQRPDSEVVNFVTAIGSSSALVSRLETDPATGPEFGKVMVQLKPPTDRKRHEDEVIEELRGMIRPWPGMIYRIDKVEEGPPGGYPVALRLTGDDLEQLGGLSQQIMADVAKVNGTIDVGVDYRPDSPELVIKPRPAVVGMFDMTEAQVSSAVQTAILGDTTIELSLDDEDVTLRIQSSPDYQRYKEDIARLMLASPTGRWATVEELAEVNRERGLYSINRYNRSRAVTVRSEVIEPTRPDEVFGVLRDRILPDYGFRPLPPPPPTDGLSSMIHTVRSLTAGSPDGGSAVWFIGKPNTQAEGVRAQFTGENEERDKNFGYLLNSMILGIALILAILVLQFNSFRQTAVVLVTVPLSFIGVVFGMWACSFPFSLASFIGLVSLTGVVVNDAIVLVDFTNQARKRGMTVNAALLEAGVNRLRPVLLTTATTIGGMMPLFLNLSGGAEFWQPLTGAVIFGLAFATVLTLVVIPVGYSLAYNFADRPSTDEAAS